VRLFLLFLITALIVPLAAYAQPPKQVEVINEPLAVEVTNPISIVEPVAVEIAEPLAVEIVNPAPLPPSARFQLVGFTTSTIGGFSFAAGSPSLFDMTATCQAEVDPLSRMCRVDEIQLTTKIPLGLPTGADPANPIRAWVNLDPANDNFSGSFDCRGWSDSSILSGMTVDARGQLRAVHCGSHNPIACCALVP